jgi:hypothetical protein
VTKIWVTLLPVSQDKTKISAYVTKELQVALNFKAEELGLSTSQLLGRIVSEYLGFSPVEEISGVSIYDQIQAVEQKLIKFEAQNEKRFSEIEATLAKIGSMDVATSPLFGSSLGHESKPHQLATLDLSPSIASKLLSGRKLAIRLGCNPSTISSHRKQGRDHFIKWSAGRDPDKIGWWLEDNGERFQPVEPSSKDCT